MDRLIVIDDVSGIADFLAIIQKYCYHCIYVFHIIVPDKDIWKKIISQTNLFSIFPASGLFHTVSKIFQSNCVPTATKYVPVCLMWLNRRLINLANQDEKLV